MNVGIVGFTSEAKSIIDSAENKLIDDLFIKYVLTDNKEDSQIYNSIKHKIITNYDRIVNDLSIDTVMVLEDTILAYDYIRYALNSKKNVITTATSVISKHYLELAKLAYENDVNLYIDGTVNLSAGITNIFDINRFKKVYHFHALLDDISSRIIDKMYTNKISYDEAVKEIGSIDKNKIINELVILSMICFDSKIDTSKVYYKGLEGLDVEYLHIIDRLGYKLRLESTGVFQTDEGISLVIEPVVYKENNPIYNIGYSGGKSFIISSKIGNNMFIEKNTSGCKDLQVLSNIHSLMKGVKCNITLKNNYDCHGNENMFSQYIVKSNYLDSKIVDKKIGNIYITKPISGTKIKEIGEIITFYARISAQLGI